MIATLLTCPSVVFLNMLVLLAFYKKPALRTQANVLLGAMALNDLVRGAVGSPLFVARELTYQMRHESNCYVNLASVYSTRIFYVDILLTIINCERYLGIKYPMWHRIHVTKSRLLVAAVVSSLVVLISMIVRTFTDEGRFLMTFILVLCTIGTLSFAVLIWRVIVKRNQTFHVDSGQNQPSSSMTRSERKAAKMATYLALGFLFTRIIRLVLLTFIFTRQYWMNIAQPLVHSLSLMTSLVNPLIYSVMNQDIRKACMELIKCN